MARAGGSGVSLRRCPWGFMDELETAAVVEGDESAAVEEAPWASRAAVGTGTGGLCMGVDIGGTKTRVGLVDADHRVLDVREAPTPARDGPRAVLEVVAGLGRALGARRADVAACGVGTAGVVDRAAGTVVASTDAIAGWAGVPLVQQLTALLGLPVRVDNDANAFALGEAAGGAAQGRAHVLAVTVGTGVGGALVIHGRLWRGAHHNAGEIGHLPVPGFGDRRCSCGAGGLAEVARRAETGDGPAVEVVEEGGGVLGQLLAGLVNAVDPESVVVGGGVAVPAGRYWAAAERHFRRHLRPAVP